MTLSWMISAFLSTPPYWSRCEKRKGVCEPSLLKVGSGWIQEDDASRVHLAPLSRPNATPIFPSDSPTSPQPGRTCRSVPLLPSPPHLHLLTSALLGWGWQDARRQEIEAKRQRLVDLRRAREERRALLESERTGSTAASGANVRLPLLLLFLPGGSWKEEQIRADPLALPFPLTPPKSLKQAPQLVHQGG